jgi:hypothetical protein
MRKRAESMNGTCSCNCIRQLPGKLSTHMCDWKHERTKHKRVTVAECSRKTRSVRKNCTMMHTSWLLWSLRADIDDVPTSSHTGLVFLVNGVCVCMYVCTHDMCVCGRLSFYAVGFACDSSCNALSSLALRSAKCTRCWAISSLNDTSLSTHLWFCCCRWTAWWNRYGFSNRDDMPSKPTPLRWLNLM